MSESLYLEVVTPDQQVVSSEVIYVGCPGVVGEFGILKGHTAFLSALKTGVLRYTTVADKEKYIFIAGGFADVNNNKVTILADAAEFSDNIDVSRAKASKERAEQRLQDQGKEDIDFIRAKSALLRSIVRLNLSQGSI